MIQIHALELPAYRTTYAIQQGIERNIIIVTWGGLGDQICAEPTIRSAIKTFKNCDISLASECPELFQHLQFKDVFDLRKVQPRWEKYYPFQTIRPPSDIQWQFMSHMLINCVDYPALCAFRCQLPIADREVRLEPSKADREKIGNLIATHYRYIENTVVIHAGRHWQSKTFPKDWWDAVIQGLIGEGFKPILIGADTDDNRGTVNVDATGCLDLRNKLTVMQTVALLQEANVLLTNDSAPLHMAASGEAWILYLATCKHPDYISHWRKGQWAWRMKNLSKGGIWDILDYCPNKEQEVSAENVGDHLLEWLPEPEEMVRWAIDPH